MAAADGNVTWDDLDLLREGIGGRLNAQRAHIDMTMTKIDALDAHVEARFTEQAMRDEKKLERLSKVEAGQEALASLMNKLVVAALGAGATIAAAIIVTNLGGAP